MDLQKAMSLALAVIATGLSGFAQGAPSPDERDRAAESRLTSLSMPLHFNGDEPDAARRYDQLKALTSQLRSEVDNYLQTALSGADGSQKIETRLRKVLSAHKPNPEYGDLPFARVANLQAGRSLIVAYTVVRGPHNDSATIRGYRFVSDRVQLVATTGDDFDGYNMFKVELPSPSRDEFWLLAWGQAQTFNGNKTRFRAYAFDGQSFKTVWSPEDMFDASAPKVAGNVLAVDHRVSEPPYSIHDEYLITVNGLIKTN